jgi:hypothetical protein
MNSSHARPWPFWVAAFALLPFGIPSAARAHTDPGGCSQTSAVLQMRVFRDDGATGVVGTVAENENIKYQAVLRKSSDGACAFSGGTFTLTLPNGTVETISNDVPCVGGTTSPCDPTVTELDSALFDYTVSSADVSSGAVTASAAYTGGVVHDNEPDTPGVSATTAKQTPVGACSGGLCENDPPDCSTTGVSIEVRAFRGDGVTGVVGPVSECENVHYQAVLRKSSGDACAFSGGTFTLTLPNGAVETISSDVPCIGGTTAPCDPTVTELDSALFDYTVSSADISGGSIYVSASYAGGLTHDTSPGTPGLSSTTPKQTLAVVCSDNNDCTNDLCDASQPGAAACSHTDIPLCTTTTSTTTTTTTTGAPTTTTTTLVPATIDHFECYRVKSLAMPKIPVSLANEFESKGVAVVKVDAACVPVDKNGEGIPDPTTYLTCYRIKENPKQPRLTPQSLTLTDQFGTKQVLAVKGRTLCVPSTKTP